jgi:tRNA(fMet)-specific endonuclease VapC
MNSRPRIVVERLANAVARRRFVAVSALSVFELAYGVARSRLTEQNARALGVFLEPLQVIAFDADDAQAAGDIRANLERIGRPVGPYDILIAAQAVRRDLLLVTANVREFARVKGLRWDDWTK